MPTDRLRFADRYKSGQLNRVTQGPVAHQIKLADQYRMLQKGDVARRLHLAAHASGAARPGGDYRPGSHGSHDRHFGRVSPHFAKHCFPYHYYGPSYFASYCWYPHWRPWVGWSWRYRCHPLYDPRPLWCRPVYYDPCPRWIWWQTPAWVVMPVALSGTWVDVEPLPVGPQLDLQLLAVRFVDPGHPEQKLGPRYRVWFRNNSSEPITQTFSVVLLAGSDAALRADLPQAGVRVRAVEAGDTQSVDLRLPIEAHQMSRDGQGNPAPFTTLHVLVDASREVPEVSEANNGTRIARADVLPVDPAAFEADPRQAASGGEVLLAGEGFGPEPGRVLLHLGGIEMEAEIRGWYDLGAQVAVPNLPLAGPTKAELIFVRGDGAAANPIEITILPPQNPGVKVLVPPLRAD